MNLVFSLGIEYDYAAGWVAAYSDAVASRETKVHVALKARMTQIGDVE